MLLINSIGISKSEVMLHGGYLMDIKVIAAQFLSSMFKRFSGCCNGKKILAAIMVSLVLGASPLYAIEQKEQDIDAVMENVEQPTGLVNFGVNCFANATLQCLFEMKEFNERLIPQASTNELIQSYLQVKNNHANVRNFIDKAHSDLQMFKEDNGRQQDAHEFLMQLMQIIEPSTVSSMVRGQQTIKCSTCNAVTMNDDRPFSLELDLNTPGDCFTNYFMHDEMLSGWNCPQCHHAVNATKKYTIQALPDFLFIQLKRFKQRGTVTGTEHDRSDALVSYPEKFSFDQQFFAPQAHTPHAFELFGVVCHSGALNGGHYTAYVKKANEWLFFNDNVQPVVAQLGEIQNSKKPYILFYRETNDFTGSVVQGPVVGGAQAQHNQQGHGTRRYHNLTDSYEAGGSDDESGEPETQKRRVDNQNSASNTQSNQPTLPYNEADYARAKKGGKELDLTNAQLDGADLTGAYLIGANLTGAHLKGATLTRANLKGAQFVRTDLSGAVLHETMLDNATFEGANLSKAKLSKIKHFDNVQIKDDTKFIETEFLAVLLHNVTIKDSTFLRSTFNGVVFNNSHIERTSMRNIKARGLAFLATSLHSLDFTLAHMCEFYFVANNVIGYDLNFQYATLSQGFIMGGLILPDGKREGVEKDYAPYTSYCIKNILQQTLKPIDDTTINTILVMDDTFLKNNTDDEKIVKAQRAIDPLHAIGNEIANKVASTIKTILGGDDTFLKRNANAIEAKIVKAGWWAQWAFDPSAIATEIANSFENLIEANFVPGKTYRSLILMARIIPLISEIAKKSKNNEVIKRYEEVVVKLNLIMAEKLKGMIEFIDRKACSTLLNEMALIESKEHFFATPDFQRLSILYDIKKEIEHLSSAAGSEISKAAKYDREAEEYNSLAAALSWGASSGCNCGGNDKDCAYCKDAGASERASAASCRSSADSCRSAASHYSHLCIEWENLLNKNSMLINSDFRGVKMENVHFSHINFSCCKNINLCRSVTGCWFENVFDAFRMNNGWTLAGTFIETEFSHAEALKEKGAMVNEHYDDGFSPMWGKTNYQSFLTHLTRNIVQSLGTAAVSGVFDALTK